MSNKQYDNTNGGAIFPNDRKEKETHPDFRGTINVEGTEYWLKGWKKTSKTGTKFLSLALNPKEVEKPKEELTAIPSDPF
jgi:uncharacterized protein (DUF736 family)